MMKNKKKVYKTKRKLIAKQPKKSEHKTKLIKKKK